MTLPQARAILPKLVARGRDPESERAAQEALLEIADALLAARRGRGRRRRSTSTSTASPALARRSGDVPAGARGDRSSRSALVAAVEKGGAARARRASPARSSRRASRRRCPSRRRSSRRGRRRSSSRRCRSTGSRPRWRSRRRLAQWGIRSIGELARLPEGEVASRLGEIGRELHATARGLRPAAARAADPAALALGGDGARVAARHARAVPLRRARGARAARRAARVAGARVHAPRGHAEARSRTASTRARSRCRRRRATSRRS